MNAKKPVNYMNFINFEHIMDLFFLYIYSMIDTFVHAKN